MAVYVDDARIPARGLAVIALPLTGRFGDSRSLETVLELLAGFGWTA
jgi:hypothetical protein